MILNPCRTGKKGGLLRFALFAYVEVQVLGDLKSALPQQPAERDECCALGGHGDGRAFDVLMGWTPIRVIEPNLEGYSMFRKEGRPLLDARRLPVILQIVNPFAAASGLGCVVPIFRDRLEDHAGLVVDGVSAYSAIPFRVLPRHTNRQMRHRWSLHAYPPVVRSPLANHLPLGLEFQSVSAGTLTLRGQVQLSMRSGVPGRIDLGTRRHASLKPAQCPTLYFGPSVGRRLSTILGCQ